MDDCGHSRGDGNPMVAIRCEMTLQRVQQMAFSNARYLDAVCRCSKIKKVIIQT